MITLLSFLFLYQILLKETRIIITRYLTLVHFGLNQSTVNNKLCMFGFVLMHFNAEEVYIIQLANKME